MTPGRQTALYGLTEKKLLEHSGKTNRRGRRSLSGNSALNCGCCGLGFETEHAPNSVGVTVASIGISCRVDRDDHVRANSADDRTILDGSAVGQLHLGRPGFRIVRPSQDDVHGLGLCDDLARLRFADRTRIGQLRQVLPISVHVANIFVRRNQPIESGLLRDQYRFLVVSSIATK